MSFSGPSQPLEYFKREDKRQKLSEALTAAFGDSLLQISIPEVVRKHDAEINQGAIEFEKKVRSVLGKSDEVVQINNERQAQEYVENRQALVNDGAFWLKKSKNVIESLRKDNILDRPTAERAHNELDQCDKALLKERAALAANKIKVQYGILSHTSHARIGEAYLAAIAESMPAYIKNQDNRNESDQNNFRKRVLAIYNTPDCDSDLHNVVSWCPISKSFHLERDIVAAHIVPYTIGEVSAAYLYGMDPENGYEAIWSVANGMLLHQEIERALDAAQIIIVPDENDENELKLVVLDESILDVLVTNKGPTFRDLNNQKLEFKTAARPSRRNLHLHYVLSLIRHKRFNVEGWENDKTKITNPAVWGTPGRWVRRSIIKALAFEIGDAEKLEEVIDSEEGLFDFPDKLSEEKEQRMAVSMRYNLEADTDEWGGE